MLKCPHMAARCPHKSLECDDTSSISCHYIVLTTNVAVITFLTLSTQVALDSDTFSPQLHAQLGRVKAFLNEIGVDPGSNFIRDSAK